MRRAGRIWVTGLAACALAVHAACVIGPVEAPPLSGPSELGLALSVAVAPDILTQDGRSTSIIRIAARDAVGRPIAGLAMRLETRVGGVPVTFGRLSSQAPITGRDGRAYVTYRAPEAPGPDVELPPATVVTFVVMPVGSDAAATVARHADLHLVPAEVIVAGDK
jgi:hypothetical protein